MQLKNRIISQIKTKGFIFLNEFMEIALSKYPYSYYNKVKSIGLDGDFITAPEVSQLFGETIGLWCIEQWHKLKCPKLFNLIEFGGGSGALLQSALKVIQLESEMIKAINIQIFDINEHFVLSQKKKLKKYNVSWIKNYEKMNDLPTIVIANEYFDALPIKQFIKKNDLWFEVVIKCNLQHNLYFDNIVINYELNDQLNIKYPLALNDAVVEESPESIIVIQSLAKHLKKNNGSALMIDYGYDLPPSQRPSYTYVSSLQAIKDHQYVDIFDFLGEVDLTSHVDFYKIKEVFNLNKFKQVGYRTQRQFLSTYGIELRANRLISLNPDKSDIIGNQLQRLININQMGNLFKVLTVSA